MTHLRQTRFFFTSAFTKWRWSPFLAHTEKQGGDRKCAIRTFHQQLHKLSVARSHNQFPHIHIHIHTHTQTMSSSTETSSLAYVFNTPAADDDEMYPFLPDDQEELPLSPSDQALLMGVYPATMSDFDFNATIQAATALQQPSSSPSSFYSNGSSNDGGATGSPMPNLHELQISNASERSKMPGLLPPSMLNDPQYQHLHHHHHQYQQMQQQQQQQQQYQQHQQSLPPPPPQAPNSSGGYEFDPRSLQAFTTKPARKASLSGSPNYSPLSNPESDIMRDSEEILNAPVKSLTEEEKKLRRRAQVAKSARKHRNRQKVRIDFPLIW